MVIGRHGCAEADLVVVPDLSFRHDVDALAAEVDLAVSLLYIVLIGVDITTQAQLAVVEGVPSRLALQHGCVRHVPASAEEVRFCVRPRLDPAVHKALRRVAGAPNSEFSVPKHRAPASGDIFFGELRDVASRACSKTGYAMRQSPMSSPLTVEQCLRDGDFAQQWVAQNQRKHANQTSQRAHQT